MATKPTLTCEFLGKLISGASTWANGSLLASFASRSIAKSGFTIRFSLDLCSLSAAGDASSTWIRFDFFAEAFLALGFLDEALAGFDAALTLPEGFLAEDFAETCLATGVFFADSCCESTCSTYGASSMTTSPSAGSSLSATSAWLITWKSSSEGSFISWSAEISRSSGCFSSS